MSLPQARLSGVQDCELCNFLTSLHIAPKNALEVLASSLIGFDLDQNRVCCASLEFDLNVDRFNKLIVQPISCHIITWIVAVFSCPKLQGVIVLALEVMKHRPSSCDRTITAGVFRGTEIESLVS